MKLEKMNVGAFIDSDVSGGGSGGGSSLVVTATYDEQTGVVTLDKTWKQIKDAFPNVCVYVDNDGALQWHALRVVSSAGGLYRVVTMDGNEFLTLNEDSFPTADVGGGDSDIPTT